MFSSSGSKYGGNCSTMGDYGFYFNLGVNVSHIIDGQQKINGETFDLISNDEFKGLFVQPIIGLDAKYYITNTIQLHSIQTYLILSTQYNNKSHASRT